MLGRRTALAGFALAMFAVAAAAPTEAQTRSAPQARVVEQPLYEPSLMVTDVRVVDVSPILSEIHGAILVGRDRVGTSVVAVQPPGLAVRWVPLADYIRHAGEFNYTLYTRERALPEPSQPPNSDSTLHLTSTTDSMAPPRGDTLKSPTRGQTAAAGLLGLSLLLTRHRYWR